MSYKLIVLMEDFAPEESGLQAEHGLSFFVQTPESNFIFDCGHTGEAWSNAEKLGINLSAAQFVVLSHSHYDHAGGFPSLWKICKPKYFYTGKNFWRKKFSYSKANDKYFYKGCGFTKADSDSRGIEHRECAGIVNLDNHARIIAGFDKIYPFEKIPAKFVRDPDKEPDPFDDEICLLLDEDDGLALIVGCSHPGILNIAATVKARTGLPIRRIVGGIHLVGAEPERIEKTLSELKSFGVREFNLCHCSGINLPGKISAGFVIEV